MLYSDSHAPAWEPAIAEKFNVISFDAEPTPIAVPL